VSFDAKSAAVVGLGKSGLAAVELLLSRGVQVTAFDEKPDAATVEKLKARGVEVVTGLDATKLRAAEVVVLSPGVPLSKPELRGARVIGEIELAWQCLPPGAGPVLGVTGTNGKSTTTALLGELVKQSGVKTFVGGNLGRPFSEACAEKYDVHVVELSSFQLEGISTFAPRGAAILNLTPDHLDRYPTHLAYGLAKARIFMNQPKDGFAVVSSDDPDTVELAVHARVPVHWFSISQREQFSKKYRLQNRALRGDHNLLNAMAAVKLAELQGVSPAAIQQGLDAFPGLAHRLELVRELHGVEWINDSKATNVDSSLVALKALPGNIWLIAGGKGKGAPYDPMVEASKGKVKGVLTIGDDAPKVDAAYRGGFQVIACGTLQNAIEEARKRTQPGDIVLLSPACASYDQFKNFEHRGESFKALVQALQ
jgi:UDP-N-acetylmuramoylalanine--D-glutamate ligase